ncbi:MAG: ATP-binding protein, partial [Ruminococcus sp.]|nr:ATP-binding protein [Ruminococcus sp.]
MVKMLIFFGKILLVILTVMSPFLVFVGAFWLYWRFIRKINPIKNEKGTFRQHGIIRRIFIDFPKQLAHDLITIDPNTFKEYGMHLLCGEQGSGKTTLMAYLVRKYKTIYPRVIVRSNFSCSIQDYELTSWEELTLDTNGIYGEIDCIDEIQNWFSSNQSKNFPPNMLTIITQQRKVRRCIL